MKLIENYIYQNPRPGSGEVGDCSVRALCLMMQMRGRDFDYDGITAFLKSELRENERPNRQIRKSGINSNAVFRSLKKLGLKVYQFNRDDPSRYDECAMFLHSREHIAYRSEDHVLFDTYDSRSEKWLEFIPIPDSNEFYDLAAKAFAGFTMTKEEKAKKWRHLDRHKSSKETNYWRFTIDYYERSNDQKFGTRGATKQFMDKGRMLQASEGED